MLIKKGWVLTQLAAPWKLKAGIQFSISQIVYYNAIQVMHSMHNLLKQL